MPSKCEHCEYDLSGVPRTDGGFVCPECGRASMGEKSSLPWVFRRRWVFIVLMSSVAAIVWMGVVQQMSGWGRMGMFFLFPAPAAIAAMFAAGIVCAAATRATPDGVQHPQIRGWSRVVAVAATVWFGVLFLGSAMCFASGLLADAMFPTSGC